MKRRPIKPGKKPPVPPQKGKPLNYLVIVLLIIAAMTFISQGFTAKTIEFSQFWTDLESKKIQSVVIGTYEIKGEFRGDAVDDPKDKPFRVDYRPSVDDSKLTDKLTANGVVWKYEEHQVLLEFFMSFIFPILLIVGLFYFLFARNMRGGAGGMLMSFGRSRHRLQGKDHVKVTFNDVAGIEEAKDEVGEIIEFLKNPKKFQRLGGRIPRGVLLVGPPGCGKTLLAKAIAGEANVPFFSISGSDFVEMFVGVGASRVRDLFKSAKDNSPCIIFLDEIDAIGRKRGAGFAGGGHDEREQTLNAILVEMDGFDTNDQVIVVAATNRGDILDHALTRPGRFDRQVIVPLPDLKGRMQILKVHAKKVKMAPDTNLERVARGTPMFSGADLEATINEAALAATMANKDHVELADLEEARDKVRWGRAKKSRMVDDLERKVTAYHEAGHTVVQCLLDDADPLHKVSIIPRGPMGGATFSLPERDRTMFTRNYCLALMQVCFGGRIAEVLFCNDISSGAQSDIDQATKVARQMIVTWGMSDALGPISYGSDQGMNDPSYYLPAQRDYSEQTAQEIDREIKHLVDQTYKQAQTLIEANKDKLDDVAQALLKYETLDASEVKLIMDGQALSKPTVGELLAQEQAKTPPPAPPSEQSPDDQA